MINNIKTEIIYYCVPSDFEFEFNLCGSCQMRLLTSLANNNLELLKALQRSITRSRAIIIVGKIKGENNIINLISQKIGYSCEKIDSDIYDITEADDIEIIQNSVPLITGGGEFGGCIIESGPQSMIFLSEDKKIRKEIMNSLVHGYLKDLSQYPIQAAKANNSEQLSDTSNNIISAEDTEDTIDELTVEESESATVDVIEKTDEEPSEEIEIENLQSLEETPTDEENPIATLDESESFHVNYQNDPFNIDNLNKENTELDISFEDDIEESAKENNKKSTGAIDIFTLILSIILLALFAFVVYSYVYLPLTNGISILDNINNIFGSLF